MRDNKSAVKDKTKSNVKKKEQTAAKNKEKSNKTISKKTLITKSSKAKDSKKSGVTTSTKTKSKSNAEDKTRIKKVAKKKTVSETKTKSRAKANSIAKPIVDVKKRVKTLADTVRKKGELKIYPIGGLKEIGKNMTVLEYEDQLLIIDCGMSFPEDDMYGIDVVIPDFSFVEKNAKKVMGLIVTHGHEDHIGGIPYLLKKISVPIYGTAITIGLIENKLKEHGIKGDTHVFNAGDSFKLGNFNIETVHTTHSVADAVCFYITTPAASLFHTGDFKIDYTPIDGKPISLEKYAEIGARGVDVMLSDSTNATRQGFTRSEKYVGETLDGIFRNAKGRIIIATFSSNVNRIQKIIDLTAKYGRHFSVSGKSMEKVVTLAQELGYLNIPSGSYVELNMDHSEADNKMVILTTGSQGEPMSALARMANDEHKNVKLKRRDTVILSSTPVPGNEKSVSNVVNKLYEKEVDVIYNEVLDIHVSGHACQEELKLIHTLIKPKFFMPVHGETRHLVMHAELAESLGMKNSRIFILSNGDQLSVSKKKAEVFRNVVSADDIMVDGLGIGDVGNAVLKERKLLSISGLVVVAATIDSERRVLMSGPEIRSQGFVYIKENEGLIREAKDLAETVIIAGLEGRESTIQEIQDTVKTEIRRFISKRTKRDPIIMPLFMEI